MSESLWQLATRVASLTSRPSSLVLLSLLAGLVCFGGCGGTGPVDTVQDGGLAAVARLYGEYALQHQGEGPRNDNDFRAFLRGLPQAQQEGMKITDLDQFFISPRDSKPYTIVFGVDTTEATPDSGLEGFPVVAYEQEGRDGKRLAANAFGYVADLNAEEFKQAVGE